MPTSVTLRDIAAHLGVSVATVSKSLSGKKDVTAATRARVVAACQELGYRPNPLVSALMRSRRRHAVLANELTLAFVTAFPTADGWRRHPAPIFRQMFAGAQARATARNYRLEHFWLHRDGMSNQRFGQMLSARGITGLLLAPVPDSHTEIELAWPAFSVVVLGQSPATKRFHRVSTDYFQSMLLGFEECVRSGYRRPGLAVRWETIRQREFRWEGAFRVAQRLFDLPDVPNPMFADEWSTAAVNDWLERERPDCVIGPVLGTLETTIRASGRRIPEDIGLVGLMVPEMGDRLSGILQDGEIIGAAAVDQLIGQVERNETGIPEHPITHTMLGRWNPGATLLAAR